MVSYPRRQQYRRLSHALGASATSVAAAVLALVLAASGPMPIAAALMVIAVGFGFYARHWFQLAERSSVGARSRTHDGRYLTMVRDQAAWLWRRRRRWCRYGAVPVLCVVRARGLRHCQHGVLVLSLDQLRRALKEAAELGSAPSRSRAHGPRAAVAPSWTGGQRPLAFTSGRARR